jgi:hypothetical protein
VRRWERRRKVLHPRLKDDGIVGLLTWSLMGVTPTYVPAHKKGK